MTSDRTVAAYDQIAALYAKRNAAMPEDLATLATRFLELVRQGAKILDVGCGAGRDMAWMEARGARVTGVDLSAGMLAEARRQVRGALLQMDMRRLNFPDARFGGVWCTASLLHLPKREAPGALREMRRVLVPHGILFLCIQEGAGEGWESAPYDVAVDRFFARYRMEETNDTLSRAGFVILACHRTDAGSRRWLQILAKKATEGGE